MTESFRSISKMEVDEETDRRREREEGGSKREFVKWKASSSSISTVFKIRSRVKRTRGRATTIRRRRLRTSDPRDYNCRIVRFCLCHGVRETLRVPDDE